MAEENGNGKRLSVPLPWVQFFFTLLLAAGGVLISWVDLKNSQEYQYVELLQEVAERKEIQRGLENRIRELELALARAGIDRSPHISITRRGDQDDER